VTWHFLEHRPWISSIY